MIIYTVGFVGHLIPALRSIMILLTTPVLLITGILAIQSNFTLNQKRFIFWFITTFAVTFAIEAAGVQTGKIFGQYVYSGILGLRFAGVPLIIGFNWVVVIFCSIRLGQHLVQNKIGSGLAASVFAVAYDGVLEPVAIRLGYWSWQSGNVPIQNYLAWWAISVGGIFLYHVFKVQCDDHVPAIYYGIQFGYFLLLSLALWVLGSIF